ncbi:MAG: Ig-like domain-containing protein, partial [Candidatus Levybacteria bacterium]|nr:Ig-like domain-containing protein [Candidatus Levybacteria bacterium]
TVISITVYRQLMSATVNASFDVAQNLPSVSLLQQYTFLDGAEEQISTNESSQLTFVEQDTTGKTVSIKRPLQGEEFIDQRPVFSGTSYPNSRVDLLIPGVAQQQILARADGSWTFQASNGISQGDHTITITVTDPSNNKITDSKSFTIFPLGSQVVESATPSATPIFRPTATQIPATPTSKPTAAPTVMQLSPTPTGAITTSPSITPTIVVSTPTSLPTIYFTPTNQPTISAPGAFENTAMLTSLSVVLIIAGIALLFAL